MTLKQNTYAAVSLLVIVVSLVIGVGVYGRGQESSVTISKSTAVENPDDFKVIGYLTDDDIAIDEISFEKLTHVHYAFLIPRNDGTFEPLLHPNALQNVVKAAHEHDVKVLIAVGGWGQSDAFPRIAAREDRRTTFSRSLADFIDEYNLDGADIDWEFPDATRTSRAQYLALIQSVRATLDDDKLLAAAVAGNGVSGEGIPTEVFPLFDYVCIMAYDNGDAQHSSMAFAEEALTYWSGRGLDQRKMILGVPFYSRPRVLTFAEIVAGDPVNATRDHMRYRGQVVYYNGMPTIAAKTKLAIKKASGIMIWTVQYDAADPYSLLTTINETIDSENF